MSSLFTSGQTATDILAFWFGTDGQVQKRWFVKSSAFDADIRQRFGAAVEAALLDTAAAPPSSADDTVARVLLLDQFTRNMFRDTPQAFAGDAQALALAEAMVRDGRDAALPLLQRWFVYMPFEHAEDLGLQTQSVSLFTRLLAEAQAADSPVAPDLEGALDYAVRHREVIARFGRFPHRNAILGRASSAEEAAFLQEPGSSF